MTKPYHAVERTSRNTPLAVYAPDRDAASGWREMSTDRDLVLARRAFFVSAALAGISAGARAEEAPKAECTPKEASESDLVTARALHQEASTAFEARAFDEAARALEEAWRLTGRAKLLYDLARAEEAGGDLPRAANHVREFLACAPEDDPNRDKGSELLARLERQVGQIRIVGLPEAANVRVDGQDATLRAKQGALSVTAGRHEILAEDTRGNQFYEGIEVAPGTVTDVTIGTLEDPCIREPDLCRPCLEPLPPPEIPSVRQAHVAIALGYALHYDLDRDKDDRAGHGLWIEPELVVPLARWSSLALGVYAAPTRTADGNIAAFGADGRLGIELGSWGFGAGVRGGWLSASIDRPRDATYVSSSGAVVEPYLDVAVVRLTERVSLGARWSLVVAHQRNADDERFATSYFTSGLWLGLALGTPCRDYTTEPCPKGLFESEDEPMAASIRASGLSASRQAGSSGD